MKKQFYWLLLLIFLTPSLFAQEGEGFFGPAGRFKMNLFPGVTSGILQQSFGGVSGERIVLEKRLGMDESRTIPELEISFGFAPTAQFYLIGSYGVFPGSKKLTSDLLFSGVNYPKDTHISLTQQVATIEGGFLVDAVRNPDGLLQVGMGLRYGLFRYTLEASSLPIAKWTQEAFFPTVRLRGEIRIFGFVFLYGDTTMGGLQYEKHSRSNYNDVKTTQFWYFNFQAGLKFALVPGVDFYVGFFRNQFQLYRSENGAVDKINFSVSGMALSFEIKF